LTGWNALLWILRDGKPAAVPVQPGLDDSAGRKLSKGDVQPGDELIIGERSSAPEKPKP
jgi:HlyD family secretion protein